MSETDALDRLAAQQSATPGLADQATRIAFFLPSLAGGGAERVMLDVAIATAKLGHQVDLVLASATGPYLRDVPPSLNLVDLARSRVATAFFPLLGYLRRARPQVLISTMDHANVVAALAAKFVPGVRVAVRQANTMRWAAEASGPRTRLLAWMVRRLYRSTDVVIAVSQAMADELAGFIGVPRERIHVVLNPVITDRLAEGARQPLDDPWFEEGQPPVVLGVGRLGPSKGFDTLIRAFGKAQERVPCRLLILGEGALRPDLESLAAGLGLADVVRMPGFADNPFQYMARAGVFVLSSRSEGLPNVLIQAMATGAPVVATDCLSGPNEILEGGRLGRLVTVDDVAGMAQAIEETLAGPIQHRPEGWADPYRLERVSRAYLEAMGVA